MLGDVGRFQIHALADARAERGPEQGEPGPIEGGERTALDDERPAVGDVREMYTNDIRFVEQF